MVTLTQSENGRCESPLTVTVKTALRRFRGGISVLESGVGPICDVRAWHHTSSVWCHRSSSVRRMCVHVLLFHLEDGAEHQLLATDPHLIFVKYPLQTSATERASFFKRHYSHALITYLWHYLTLLYKKHDSGWSAPHADPSLVTPWVTSRGQCRSEAAWILLLNAGKSLCFSWMLVKCHIYLSLYETGSCFQGDEARHPLLFLF